MTAQANSDDHFKQLNEAIATATLLGSLATKAAVETVRFAADGVTQAANTVGETVGPTTQQWVEQGTETVGRVVMPIAENPLLKYAGKIPGVKLLLAAVGQVDAGQVQRDVEKLRQKYPAEAPDQLAHRVMVETAIRAGGVGLVTNIIPPIALTLFAIDLAAVTALQAEMVYRIASIYGFPLHEPSRRGEVLAVFALSLSGSGVLKVGLGGAELLPLVGPVVGASNNAALIYSLGYVASRFYEAKQKSALAQG